MRLLSSLSALNTTGGTISCTTVFIFTVDARFYPIKRNECFVHTFLAVDALLADFKQCILQLVRLRDQCWVWSQTRLGVRAYFPLKSKIEDCQRSVSGRGKDTHGSVMTANSHKFPRQHHVIRIVLCQQTRNPAGYRSKNRKASRRA
jgi:hypothetical protein